MGYSVVFTTGNAMTEGLKTANNSGGFWVFGGLLLGISILLVLRAIVQLFKNNRH